MGKLGILWELDRSKGSFVAAHDLGYQTIVDVDRKTGKITYRPGMIPQDGVPIDFSGSFCCAARGLVRFCQPAAANGGQIVTS